MIKLQFILLFVTIIIFLCFGGVIDYWQAAMEHKKNMPEFLKNYFLVIWLFIYTGILPFLLVLIASNFNLSMALIFVAAASIGSVLWDIVYSLLDTGKPFSEQAGYFVLKQKNYGLGKNQVIVWHIIRSIFGMLLIFLLQLNHHIA